MAIEFNLDQSEIKGLDNLILKAYENQWHHSKRINWDQKVIITPELSIDDYRDMISQLYYTEIFTVSLCRELMGKLNHFQCQNFLATQILDEMRHGEIYKIYAERVGGLIRVNDKLEKLFISVTSWKGHPIAQILAVNVFLEGEALNQQKKRIDTLPCPLFQQINQEIMKDESRHNAFGILYVREFLQTLSKDEVKEVFTWIKSLWTSWEMANDNRYESEGAKVLQTGKSELEGRFEANLSKIGDIGAILDQL